VESGEFPGFFRDEIAALVQFVQRAGFDAEQAKDAAQDAMMCAYTHWAEIRTNPRAWVRTTAYNMARADVVRLRKAPVKAVAGGWTGRCTNPNTGEEMTDFYELELDPTVPQPRTDITTTDFDPRDFTITEH
jgi:DNA-directed RNA polymerase specialized sigma24 family protein